MKTRYIVSGMVATVMATSASADEAKFRECVENAVEGFVGDMITVDILGMINNTTKRKECFKHLDPSDPSYDEIVEQERFWSEVHQQAIRCGGCNI